MINRNEVEKEYLIISQNSDTDNVNVCICFCTENTLDKIISDMVKEEVKKHRRSIDDWWTCKYGEIGKYDTCVGMVQYYDSHTNYWVEPLEKIKRIECISDSSEDK